MEKSYVMLHVQQCGTLKYNNYNSYMKFKHSYTNSIKLFNKTHLGFCFEHLYIPIL